MLITKSLAYTDGAFSSRTKKIGSGVFLKIKDINIDGVMLPWLKVEASFNIDTLNVVVRNSVGKIDPKRTARTIENFIRYGSQIGELRAATAAIKMAQAYGSNVINIYYDREDLLRFSHSDNVKPQHRNIPFLCDYAATCDNAREIAQLCLYKVKAHSGNKLNERVDKLATGKELPKI